MPGNENFPFALFSLCRMAGRPSFSLYPMCAGVCERKAENVSLGQSTANAFAEVN